MSIELDGEQLKLLQTLTVASDANRRPFETDVAIPHMWSETGVHHPHLPDGRIVVLKSDFDLLKQAGFIRITKDYGEGEEGISDYLIIKFVVSPAGKSYLRDWEKKKRQAESWETPRGRRWKRIKEVTNHQVVGGYLVWVLGILTVFLIGLVGAAVHYWWGLG